MSGAVPDPELLHAELLQAARAWMAMDPDPATRDELAHLIEARDAEAIADRFSTRLGFGTSGIRGPLGAGPNRLNRVVVRQVAAGIAAWVQARVQTRVDVGPTQDDRAPVVVVGHDARHGSVRFAADAVGVLAAQGARVLQFPEAVPTPLVAFAVLHLAADAGVMITASHNPAGDNGLKVYGPDGSQLVPPDDIAVTAAVEREVATGAVPPVASVDDPHVEVIGSEVDNAYRSLADRVYAAARTCGPPSDGLRVVYTPLHGVAGALAVDVFERAGLSVEVVAAQAVPDPDFPTTRFPNPEEPGALDLALDRAVALSADLVLAHDPDGDRLGVAIPDRDGGWRVLTGDEVGALLADHQLRATEELGSERLVVTTIVSSALVPRLAEAHGVVHRETLTGFKWLMRPVIAHPEWRLVLAYEESLGYAVTSAVHDKDGITAALVIAAVADEAKAAGRSPLDRLDDLARTHGLHVTRRWNLRDDRPGGAGRLADRMAGLRRNPPAQLAGRPVVSTVDLASGGGSLPPTDALRFDLADDARVLLRPSGTEPTLKAYLHAVEVVGNEADLGPARARGMATLGEIEAAVASLVAPP